MFIINVRYANLIKIQIIYNIIIFYLDLKIRLFKTLISLEDFNNI